jgi:cytochrome c
MLNRIAIFSTLALAVGIAAPGSAAALKGDAANGGKLFATCSVCHVTTAGVNRMGPSLHAVVGRQAGTAPNYVYSPAMKASGITWKEPKLDEFLEAPRTVVPGTKMFFAGVKAPQDRADIIAYLKTQ